MDEDQCDAVFGGALRVRVGIVKLVAVYFDIRHIDR